MTVVKKSHMYKLSVKQYNPYVGCKHGCVYCPSSFQAQLKRWAKGKCSSCYKFIPHAHRERLSQTLPKTRFMQFIFAFSNGDVAFCPTPFLKEVIAIMLANQDKTFLVQSKNPKTFNRVAFPENVILGITLETNRDELYEGISNAPKPSQRYKDFLEIKHPLKMVTIEPAVDFDVDVMVSWIKAINPCIVFLGYDSKHNYLPEPELRKAKLFHWKLAKEGFCVILKKIRRAWWEK